MDNFMDLVKSGRIAEARELVEKVKAKTKNSPTRIAYKKGQPARFYRGNKRVEQDANGIWHVVPPTKRS